MRPNGRFPTHLIHLIDLSHMMKPKKLERLRFAILRSLNPKDGAENESNLQASTSGFSRPVGDSVHLHTPSMDKTEVLKIYVLPRIDMFIRLTASSGNLLQHHQPPLYVVEVPTVHISIKCGR